MAYLLSLTHLSLNTFFFSFKTQASFDTFCTPHIWNAPLEHVLSYNNYLGVTICYNNLSCSSHVHNLSKKARKLIGFLYRNFYKGSPSSTLLNIYTSHIPEYCSTACVTHFSAWVSSTVCPKIGFKELVDFLFPPPHQIHHNLCFFPNPPFHPHSNTSYYLYNHSHNNLSTFLVRTSSFYLSFSLYLKFSSIFYYWYTLLWEIYYQWSVHPISILLVSDECFKKI